MRVIKGSVEISPSQKIYADYEITDVVIDESLETKTNMFHIEIQDVYLYAMNDKISIIDKMNKPQMRNILTKIEEKENI